MCCTLVVALLLAGCAAGSVTSKETAGEPTVYATVNAPPNPLLVGCYMIFVQDILNARRIRTGETGNGVLG